MKGYKHRNNKEKRLLLPQVVYRAHRIVRIIRILIKPKIKFIFILFAIYIHNWPLQPFRQDHGLASHTAHVVC